VDHVATRKSTPLLLRVGVVDENMIRKEVSFSLFRVIAKFRRNMRKAFFGVHPVEV
jgi:hypothetical protein